MDTSESIHLLLSKRFVILKQCCEYEPKYTQCVKHLHATYMEHVAIPLLKCYEVGDTDDYYRIVVSLDIEGRLNMLYNSFTLSADTRVKQLLKRYVIEKINRTLAVEEDTCKCNAVQCEDSEGSFTYCAECGLIRKQYCINTLYNSTHTSGHNNVKYFEKQFEVKILGKGPPMGIVDSYITKIRMCMYDDDVFFVKSVNEVREYLTKTKLTKYNKYAAHIKYRIEKKDPAVIPKYEYTSILQRACKIIELWSKYDSGKNIPYMFLGWKLVEIFVKNRKTMLELLSNIHLPERDTIRARDKTWKKVVKELRTTDKEIYYQSTDRHLPFMFLS